MRRRWLMWTGVTALVAALTLGGLALAGPGAPFEFLGDRNPVYKTEQTKAWTYYSFPASYPNLVQTAGRELELRCFTPAYVTEGCMESAAFERKKGGPIYDVKIMRDWVIDSQGQQIDADGWVTVILEGQFDDGLFHRARKWMGL